jgi:hypothetical protein
MKHVLLVAAFAAMPPLVGVTRKVLAASTKFSQTSMAGQNVRQHPPPKFEEDVDGSPLEGAIDSPAAAITEDVEDIDGRPPGGAVSISSSDRYQS